jgi:hypothetical protein
MASAQNINLMEAAGLRAKRLVRWAVKMFKNARKTPPMGSFLDGA